MSNKPGVKANDVCMTFGEIASPIESTLQCLYDHIRVARADNSKTSGTRNHKRNEQAAYVAQRKRRNTIYTNGMKLFRS